MKERISLTLESGLINNIDAAIDNVKFRSRSHVIEYLLQKGLGKAGLKKAYILAGGPGTRLRPITYEIPKPLMPIKGKPILEYHVDLLRKYEVRDIMIAINYLGDRIKNYFKDGNNHGVKIQYLEEETPLGTAGGLRLAKPMLDQTFVMANGDNLINIDLHDMYEFHVKNNAMATIALITVDDPSSFGVAKMQGPRILDFIEKPKREEAPSNLINAGVYILEPEVIDLVPKGFSMIEKDVFPKIAQMNRLFGYSFNDQWFPTDNADRYEKAIKEWRGIR